jgi:hypothetical protein
VPKDPVTSENAEAGVFAYMQANAAVSGCPRGLAQPSPARHATTLRVDSLLRLDPTAPDPSASSHTE